VICVSVLAAAGVGMSIFGFGFVRKTFLPLQKSLKELDPNGIAPYELALGPLEITNDEILRELGTEEYIQWVLRDTEVAEDSGVGRLMLFITYYGLPDRVPHVPEECYTGGGYERKGSSGVTFRVDDGAGFRKSLPGTCLFFGGARGEPLRRKFPVLYFFKVNGEYAGDRNDARIALNKALFARCSYFCKIEIVFNQTSAAPNRAEAVAASEKLLGVILPILEREHWPDWRKALKARQTTEVEVENE
jgi:hypothetical protein